MFYILKLAIHRAGLVYSIVHYKYAEKFSQNYRSGSALPMNPAPLLSVFANLLTKGRIKYGVTGSVRVRVMVRYTVRVSF